MGNLKNNNLTIISESPDKLILYLCWKKKILHKYPVCIYSWFTLIRHLKNKRDKQALIVGREKGIILY